MVQQNGLYPGRCLQRNTFNPHLLCISRYFSILRDCQLWRHLHQHQSKHTILPHFCHSFSQLTLRLMSSSEVSWSWLTKYKCWKIQAWNKECSVVVILTHTDSAGNFLRKTFFFGHGSLNTWFLHPLNHLINKICHSS